LSDIDRDLEGRGNDEGRTAGSAFERFMEVVRRLRGEGGCPWDREQTHRSLKPYLIEEAYETIEAIDAGKPDKLSEELGDVLLQVALHAVIGEEEGDFGPDDVIAGITEKMIRRHPHVFAGVKVADSQEVLRRWDRIKQKEKEGRSEDEPRGLMAGIPRELPALMRAIKVQERAARRGFTWPTAAGAIDKAKEELAELALGYGREDQVRIGDEIGDLLFALVNLARLAGVEPEEAITQTTTRFAARFEVVEEEALRAGRRVEELGASELLRLWQKAKGNHRRRGD
jgi:tetrapyrrole methylase family protein/MazG family protein